MTSYLFMTVALCFAGANSMADEKPKGGEDGPFEIDFSPLDGIKGKCRLTVTIYSKAANKNTPISLNLPNEPEAKMIAKAVFKSLPDLVEAKQDGAKVIIKSFDGKPISKIEIEALGLPQGTKSPTAKRIPKEEKKDLEKK